MFLVLAIFLIWRLKYILVMMTMISEATTSAITNVTTILIANAAPVERSWSSLSSSDELQLPVYCVPHNILDTLLHVNKSGNCDLINQFCETDTKYSSIWATIHTSISIKYKNEVIKTHGIVSCKAKKIETKHTKIKKAQPLLWVLLHEWVSLLRVKSSTMRQHLNLLRTHTICLTIFLPLSIGMPKL